MDDFPLRKRLRLKNADYADPARVYFITACAVQNTAPFFAPTIADQVVSSLMFLREKDCFRLYVYCVMPDHLHLALSPSLQSGPVSEIVRRLKSFTTQHAHAHGIEGPIWQKSFYDHIIRSDEGLLGICRYILANPVRKGLTERFGQWPYAGLVDSLPI